MFNSCNCNYPESMVLESHTWYIHHTQFLHIFSLVISYIKNDAGNTQFNLSNVNSKYTSFILTICITFVIPFQIWLPIYEFISAIHQM